MIRVRVEEEKKASGVNRVTHLHVALRQRSGIAEATCEGLQFISGTSTSSGPLHSNLPGSRQVESPCWKG